MLFKFLYGFLAANECKFPAGFAAVFIHQRHIAGGAEKLPSAHETRAGIIAQGLGKEQPAILAGNDLGGNTCLASKDVAHDTPRAFVLAHPLGNDVACSLQGLIGILHLSLDKAQGH